MTNAPEEFEWDLPKVQLEQPSEPLTKKSLDDFLSYQVFGRKYAGLAPKYMLLSWSTMVDLRFWRFNAYCRKKYKDRMYSKWYWINLWWNIRDFNYRQWFRDLKYTWNYEPWMSTDDMQAKIEEQERREREAEYDFYD